MKIIGISGKAGSGKNYIAEKILVPLLQSFHLNSFVIAFADHMKINLAIDNDINYEDLFIEKSEETRVLMQRYATDQHRNKDPNRWIKALEIWIKIFESRTEESSVFIIPDVRFQNEAEWIRSKGGYLIRVDGQNRIEKVYNHSSETELDSFDSFDLTIENGKNTNKNDQEFILSKFIITKFLS